METENRKPIECVGCETCWKRKEFPSSVRTRMFVPVISAGIRSGVNCILENLPSIDLARTLASVVLPVPGVASSKIWPPATMAVMTISIVCPFPMMTFWMFSLNISSFSFALTQASVVIASDMISPLVYVISIVLVYINSCG